MDDLSLEELERRVNEKNIVDIGPDVQNPIEDDDELFDEDDCTS